MLPTLSHASSQVVYERHLFKSYYIDLARAKSEALVNNTYKPKKINRVVLNGDDDENGFKTNGSNWQKNKLHLQHTFSSN